MALYGFLCAVAGVCRVVLWNYVFLFMADKLRRVLFSSCCSCHFVEVSKMAVRASLKKNAFAFFLFLSFINNNNNNIYRY